MKGNFGGTLRGLLAGAALAMSLCGSGLSARAQGLDEPFREPYLKALQGKVVVYFPVSIWRKGGSRGSSANLSRLVSRSLCAILTGAPMLVRRRSPIWFLKSQT